MKMEKEMKYEAPDVEVLEFMVEAGFAGSGATDGSNQGIPDVPEDF
ncbi:hypothetical protein [Bacteroides rodentium]|jgi:hypothetical protein|nr:hypothetical protein [Bacteroides rodentium]